MNDLRFMIVNSNLDHSQALKSELDDRVSFEVYQDTKEKNIWKLMEGGKDDVYVYDRCGRLAYYIPFPLSIMTSDDALVPSAILAAYYRSPCGDTCDNNDRSSLEDILNSNIDTSETTTEQVNVTTDIYQTSVPSNRSEEVKWNETISFEDDELLKAAENGSDFFSSEEFDYTSFNYTIDDHEGNDTHIEPHVHKSELPVLFFGNGTHNETIEDSNFTSSSNDSQSADSPRNITNDNPLIIDISHSYRESNDTEAPLPKDKNNVPKRKFDRCAEAGISVCKNWSKRRLLRAQTCCSADHASVSKSQICKNFGKKRCKKIRTVLKCCIKTAYVETTTAENSNFSETTTVEDSNLNVEGKTFTTEFPTVSSTETVTEVQFDVVCCKDTPNRRLCRVSLTRTCEGDEYVSGNSVPIDNAPLENTN